MRLLVLGGTSFVGRHLVDTALDHGHEVTIFHRGRTNPQLFHQADHRLGDRGPGDYSALSTGSWDATVDVSAYLPRHVEQALDALGSRHGHYVLVSSVSAYDPEQATRDEGSPRFAPPAPDTERIDAETYGPLKAACERLAEDRLASSQVAIVRPTYVVGPYDPTDRFTYWSRVMDSGGRIPVAWPDEPLQVIDVRDLAAFMLRLTMTAASGIFDAVGPYAPLAAFLADLAAPERPYELVDVGAEALDTLHVSLPMVDGDPRNRPLMTRLGTRAVEAGLDTRPLGTSASDTVAWDIARGRPALRVGPSADQRAMLMPPVSWSSPPGEQTRVTGP